MLKHSAPGLLPVLWVLATPLVAAPPAFQIGVCTHFSQGKGYLSGNLDAIAHAGITAIRDEGGWAAVERSRGTYRVPESIDTYVRAAAARGLTVLFVLDYANPLYDDGDRPRSAAAIEGFCRYAEFVAHHFRGVVGLYELWNEWDIGIGLPEPHRQGGSAEDYTALLRAVYPRLKAADPGATIVAGACTSGGVDRGWLDGIVSQGALTSCDAISVHAYNYGKGFPERSPEACARWLAAIQARLRSAHAGHDVPFYVTEMGWPTHTGKRGTAPELSASYLARLTLLARRSPSFRGLWWYDFQDDGWNPEENEDNFGIVRPDLSPKPHYGVLGQIAGLVTRGRYRDTLPAGDPNLQVLRFTHNDRAYWALWSADDRERQVVLQTGTPERGLTVQVLGMPPRARAWGWRDWTARRPAAPDELSLTVGHRPLLLSGPLEGVRLVRVRDRARNGDYEHRR